MSAYFLTRLQSWTRLAFLAVLLLAARSAQAQLLDLNHNGISDVWELVYGAAGSDPNLDSDGDGVADRLEAVAGTDPRDPRSVARISACKMTTNGFQVTMAGALGKRFELQSSEVANGNTAIHWITEGSIVARSNPVVTLTAPGDRPGKFFRVTVSDVDT